MIRTIINQGFYLLGLAFLLQVCGFNMACSQSNNQGLNNVIAGDDEKYAALRKAMVQNQIVARNVEDPKVIAAMLKVPRHLFVPANVVPFAYQDSPQGIGYDQTISQPYIVAFMTEALKLKGNERVLEIGTGSGYQAAILAEIAREVYTIEIVAPLATKSQEVLAKLGYTNVKVKPGDGYLGWQEYAPFDAIIVTCSPNHIPLPLQQQLKIGGKMIIPVGEQVSNQWLVHLEKVSEDSIVQKKVLAVRFVPMTGEAEKK